MTMRQHMETTLHNVEIGLGSWDREKNISLSAAYDYDGSPSIGGGGGGSSK